MRSPARGNLRHNGGETTSSVLEKVLSRLKGVRPRGDDYVALCPSHDDHHPSLSVSQGKDGRVLVNCFAGCDWRDVIRAIGLEPRALYSARSKGATKSRAQDTKPNRAPGSFDAEYDYRDADGKLLYQVVRYSAPHGKAFSFRRPTSDGHFIWGARGVRRVLYRLPEVSAAVRDGKVVFLPEGEKDVDTLHAEGLCATTNASGANAPWLAQYTEALMGADVVILRDEDEPGVKCAEKRAHALYRKARRIRLIILPRVGPGGDITDFLTKCGGTIEELLEIVEQTPPWEPPPSDGNGGGDEPDEPGPWGYELNDLGNAKRLVHLYGHMIRFVPHQDCWLVWDGQIWRRDEDFEIHRLAASVLQSINEEILETDDASRRANLARHFLASGAGSRINHMIRLARTRPGICIAPYQLDASPFVLALENGTLDLSTGELREHSPLDYHTRVLPFRYDPQAKCPQWMKFLTDVMADDREMIEFLQRSAGYALTGDTREQKLWLHHGEGQNGKSTFLEVLRALLGPFAKAADFETFLASRNRGGPRDDIATLVGARVVTAAEVPVGRRLDETAVKQLTGCDRVSARPLYGKTFEFTPTFKVHLATNHLPVIKDPGKGIWRRMLCVPWGVTVAKPDKDLLRKLLLEMPGIFAWAVQGCLEWQRDGLQEPDKVLIATRTYREEMDDVAQFLAEATVVVAGEQIRGPVLYAAYRTWCERNGQYPISPPNQFHPRVAKLAPTTGFVSGQTGGTKRYDNLALATHDHVEQPDRRSGEQGGQGGQGG